MCYLLNLQRLSHVRDWRAALEKDTVPATLEEFEITFGADETRFPRRGRVELSQRFDSLIEGAWEVGAWVPVGVGWQAPRQAGIEQVITSKVPTLLLRDPFDLQAGPVEVVVDVEVPLDARARLVVVSAIGFHCAFVTGAGEIGRVVAGSRDLEGVIERAMGGEGEEFPGLRPGQSHQIMLLATDQGRQCAYRTPAASLSWAVLLVLNRLILGGKGGGEKRRGGKENILHWANLQSKSTVMTFHAS